MVGLSIHLGNTVNEEFDALSGKLKGVDGLSVAQLYNEQVQRLFSYGMNACRNRELVKDCLLALFAVVRNRPEPIRSADSRIFRLFRGILVHQLVDRTNSSVTNIPESLFQNGPVQTQHVTSLQREAMYLRFNSGLSCDEVSIVMGLRVDQVRSQVTQAVEALSHQLSER